MPSSYSIAMSDTVQYLSDYHRNDALAPGDGDGESAWVVLRCQRSKLVPQGASGPARYPWEWLPGYVAESFVPLKQQVSVRRGRRTLATTLAIPMLVFANDTAAGIQRAIDAGIGVDLFQVKGRPYRQPLVVADDDMRSFMAVMRHIGVDRFYTPDEYKKLHLHQRIKVFINDQWVTGVIQKIQGSKYPRLLVTIPDFLAASTKIDLSKYDFVELAD